MWQKQKLGGWGVGGVCGGGLIFHQSYLVLFHLLIYVVHYRDEISDIQLKGMVYTLRYKAPLPFSIEGVLREVTHRAVRASYFSQEGQKD